MTREQWLKDQIRSLQDAIATQDFGDGLDQARIAFLQDVFERQQEALLRGPVKTQRQLLAETCRSN